MLLVTGLCSFFSFCFFVVFFCFGFNDIGGGRFGRIAGVFFEKGDAFFESNDFFECGFE